jgi:hypothetical protein
MHIAFDLDNTLDTAPNQMQSLMASLKEAGHEISIITGCSSAVPTDQDRIAKAEYLKSLGFASVYRWLIVVGDPPHARKAWICKHGLKYPTKDGTEGPGPVDVLYDNSIQNARLGSKHSLVFVPWNTVQD